MTQEMLQKVPLDLERLKTFRDRVLPELKKTPELYYEYDVRRFEEDDMFAHKFIAHQVYLDSNEKNLMDRSVKMVLKNFKWRKEFGVQDIKKEELPAEFFDKKGCFHLKEDKDGRQVVVIEVNKLRKTRSGERPLGEKFFVYWMENIYQTNEYGITVIIDCTDATLNNVNMDMVDFAKFALKKHYPCFLGYFLVFKMPHILEAVWDVIKKLLPRAGIDRIKFVDKKSILDYIDKDKLPERFGGTDQSEFRYDEILKNTDELFREKIEEQMARRVQTVSLN